MLFNKERPAQWLGNLREGSLAALVQWHAVCGWPSHTWGRDWSISHVSCHFLAISADPLVTVQYSGSSGHRPEAGDKNWWIKLHAHYGAKHAEQYLAGGIWGTVNNVVLSTHMMLNVCVMIVVAWCIWSFASAELKANLSAVMKTVNNEDSIL